MTDIEQLKQKISDHLFELWSNLPEPKWAYPYYKQKVSMAIDNWYPPKTEKRLTGSVFLYQGKKEMWGYDRSVFKDKT